MKKTLGILALALALVLVFTACSDGGSGGGNVKMGQAYTAAHGDRAFTVATAAVDGDKIVGAYLDEFQFSNADNFQGVPNSDATFGENFPEGMVLASKRVNDAPYSASMEENGGATQNLAVSYAAIEEYCVGKTISELESEVSGMDDIDVVDIVAGSTLTDTKNYILSIVEAAKNA